MNHRISAGVLVEADSRILLVHHRKPGAYDFWVAPGGGAEGTEDLRATAIREVREECGLDVELMRIAYIEDLHSPNARICKLWFTGRVVGGVLSTKSAAACAENIVEAAFLSREEFEGKNIFPPVLAAEYWRDNVAGFSEPRYLGLRQMEFF